MLCFSLCVLEGFIETYGQVVSAVLWIQSVALLFVLQRESSFSAIMAAELLCRAKAGKAIATLNNTLSISKHNANDG